MSGRAINHTPRAIVQRKNLQGAFHFAVGHARQHTPRYLAQRQREVETSAKTVMISVCGTDSTLSEPVGHLLSRVRNAWQRRRAGQSVDQAARGRSVPLRARQGVWGPDCSHPDLRSHHNARTPRGGRSHRFRTGRAVRLQGREALAHSRGRAVLSADVSARLVENNRPTNRWLGRACARRRTAGRWAGMKQDAT